MEVVVGGFGCFRFKGRSCTLPIKGFGCCGWCSSFTKRNREAQDCHETFFIVSHTASLRDLLAIWYITSFQQTPNSVVFNVNPSHVKSSPRVLLTCPGLVAHAFVVKSVSRSEDLPASVPPQVQESRYRQQSSIVTLRHTRYYSPADLLPHEQVEPPGCLFSVAERVQVHSPTGLWSGC